MAELATLIGDWAIPLLIAGIIAFAAARRVPVYERFVEGAREGFEIGVKIIPYLVAILVAVGMLRASGAIQALAGALSFVLEPLGVPPEVLPMILVRPMSGGAAQGLVGDALATHGPGSLVGRMMSVMAGSTETTFYVLAVYFGAIGVRRVRHTLPAALIADAAGLIAAIFFTRLFFS